MFAECVEISGFPSRNQRRGARALVSAGLEAAFGHQSPDRGAIRLAQAATAAAEH
jgi:hypothetical protein